MEDFLDFLSSAGVIYWLIKRAEWGNMPSNDILGVTLNDRFAL